MKRILTNKKIIAAFIAIIILTITVIGIYAFIKDFYDDYKCSTTNDVEWFMKNNCMRYVK